MCCVISKILDRAELLLGRGEIHMARVALSEVNSRLAAGEEVGPNIMARVNHLISNVQLGQPKLRVPKVARLHPDCHKCHGTGVFGHLGKCFACLGKGWQTKKDVVRELNNEAKRLHQARAEDLTLCSWML